MILTRLTMLAWSFGGGFTISSVDAGAGYGSPTNTRIINNRFGGNAYGPISSSGSVERSGNVWDATGEPIPGG